jgi:hypothetical protein
MDEDTEDEVFPGFWHPKAKKGFTQLPHELIDILPYISDVELRVILYIFRHTWGFSEFGQVKKITTDEFMHGRKRSDGSRLDDGTGLSDRGVKNGIAQALDHGYIFCETDGTDKARVKKSYGIKIFNLEKYQNLDEQIS